ncbi:hypothetical protein BKA69DRAFT_896336 [Paraphysoderma sedebokerense]|nr:hypothetical protein BKA69DRAFT_896336 [Paraphysoderma sedebokerense]
MFRLIFLIYLAVFCPFYAAYDTGHHADVTRNSMLLFNYSSVATDTAVLMNWFTDLYAFSLSFGRDIIVPKFIPELESMHCDNLYNFVYAANYMSQLVINTRNAIHLAVRHNDPLLYLAMFGSSVHTVQDFYTHSNWASIFYRTSCSCLESGPTFYQVLKSVNGNVTEIPLKWPQLANLRTYSWDGVSNHSENLYPGQVQHGDYCSGINQDSYVRPTFEQSYAHALSATLEWLFNVENWAGEINSTFVDYVKIAYVANNTEQLAANLRSSFVVSYAASAWVFGENDGHYKGAGSGNTDVFIAATVSLARSNTVYTRLYTDQDAYKPLVTPSLYTNRNISNNPAVTTAAEYITPYSSIPQNYLPSSQLFVLRTLWYQTPGRSLLDAPNAYSQVAFNIHSNIMIMNDAPMKDQRSFRPYWTSIMAVPSLVPDNVTNVGYTLLEAADQSVYGVTSDDGRLNITIDATTMSFSGDISGQLGTTFNTTGGRSTAEIFLLPLQYGDCGNPKIPPMPDTYCNNTAYGSMLLFQPNCKGAA